MLSPHGPRCSHLADLWQQHCLLLAHSHAGVMQQTPGYLSLAGLGSSCTHAAAAGAATAVSCRQRVFVEAATDAVCELDSSMTN
jgi:hypothetical protein